MGNTPGGGQSHGAQISVAMATYNGEKLLPEQLKSLEQQTLLPRELVVTDDGSTDGTIALLERFASQAPFPVRIHKNPQRLGYADNFLRAATLCTGEFVAFCDQDDSWLEAKLQVCSNYLNRSAEIGLVVHAAETWDGTHLLGKHFPSFDREEISDPGTLNSFRLIPGFAMVFRRSLLDLTNNSERPGCIFGLDNGSIMAHDSWIWLLATSTMKVATVPDVLCLYRQHGTNTVGAPRKRGLMAKLSVSARPVNYAALTEMELRSSNILGSLPGEKVRPNNQPLQRVAARLRRLSRMHQYRTDLYKADATVLRRLVSFLGILLLGGYLPDRIKARLGLGAAVKDLCFGIPGVYKRFARE